MTITIDVKFPNVHHNHWGIAIRDTNNNPIDDCELLTDRIIKISKEMGWQPFHQGGFHVWDERCIGWHFIEFWGLAGEVDHEEEVQTFINNQLKGQG
jgi:hypothetical protein